MPVQAACSYGRTPIAVCLTLLLLAPWISAMPAGLGLYPTHKRDDVHGVLVKESVSSETIQLLQLRRQVDELTEELHATRESLKLLRDETNTRFDSIAALTPASHPMTCRTDFTWWHDAVGKSLEYLDNFDIQCDHGEFLRQWRMTWGERDKKKAIRYVCCRFKEGLS